jgi:hypothetical protein
MSPVLALPESLHSSGPTPRFQQMIARMWQTIPRLTLVAEVKNKENKEEQMFSDDSCLSWTSF